MLSDASNPCSGLYGSYINMSTIQRRGHPDPLVYRFLGFRVYRFTGV